MINRIKRKWEEKKQWNHNLAKYMIFSDKNICEGFKNYWEPRTKWSTNSVGTLLQSPTPQSMGCHWRCKDSWVLIEAWDPMKHKEGFSISSNTN